MLPLQLTSVSTGAGGGMIGENLINECQCSPHCDQINQIHQESDFLGIVILQALSH